jgi:hypothetical protein
MTNCISQYSFCSVSVRLISATGLYPFINLIFLEFPKTPHAVGRHTMLVDSLVHGVITDPEVFAYLGDWMSQNVLGLRTTDTGVTSLQSLNQVIENYAVYHLMSTDYCRFHPITI